MTQEITAKLNRLAELIAHRDVLVIDWNARREQIMQTVRHELDALDAELAPLSAGLQLDITALEAEVKAAVLANGDSVKGDRLTAVYMRGRPSWNDDALNGYAIDNPAILAFRTQGKPSVTIRTKGGK